MLARTSRNCEPHDWRPTARDLPKLSKQVRIPHRVDDVFELVSDISRYPEFIKWIRSMKVTEKPAVGVIRRFRGEADVGFKGFSEVFSTDVEANPDTRTINVELVHGPFRRLKNRWKLEEVSGAGTRIEFFIDYEFRNPVLALLARANTDLAVNRIMKAFQDEADRRYGTSLE